ncbi:MAG: hypothetical protein ABI946_04480 [Chthoniobacterales bacterium]
MKKPFTFTLAAFVVVGFLTGTIFGRYLLAPSSEAHPEARRKSEALLDSTADSSSTAKATQAAAAVETRTSALDAKSSGKTLEAILSTKDARQRSRALRLYLEALQPSEFADALKGLKQITNSNERDLASRLLTAQWVMTDPDGALQFAAGNHSYDYLAVDVFRERAASDLKAALRGAQEIPGNDLRYAALKGVLQFQTDQDPLAALELAKSLGDFRGKEPLTNAIYRQWAQTNPVAAGNSAAQDPQEGWRSPITQVASTWADQDPVAAAQWALSISDAATRTRSVSEVMRQWSRDEPAAAANWIYSLETGPMRDSAVAGFASSIASVDPQTALGWIGTMSDEAERQRTLRRVGRIVLWRDPANGPALLQTAGLPADQIEALSRRGRGRDQ